MMASRGAQVASTMDDMITLAKVIADPKALAKLRDEFDARGKEIADAQAVHDKVLVEAKAAALAAEERAAELNKREAAHVAAATKLAEEQAAHADRVSQLATSVERVRKEARTEESRIEAKEKAAMDRVNAAGNAVDARTSRLDELDRDLMKREAAVGSAQKKADAAQKKADALIAQYTALVDRVKSAVA